MIFEKPNVLYFLFLLIIPILVHLFQLRKYKTTKFSNVALLQRIQLQTRKSSKLKKWLILTTRLLGLAFLVLAFSKPIIPSSETALKDNEIVIYLDNSFSMELPGNKLSLLEEAKQNLWEQLDDEQTFSLITNDKTWKNVTKNQIKTDFFSIDFVPVHLSFNNLLLKAESLFQKEESSHRLFMISDALNFQDDVHLKSDATLNWIVKQASSLENFNITSAQLLSNNTNKTLQAEIKSYNKTDKDITISLYDDTELIAKTKANFDNNTSTLVNFDLSNRAFKRGKIELEADGMSYDNSLFFSLNKEKQIRVISLHSKKMNKSFLASIYQTKLFDFHEYSISNFDYSLISEAHLVILNEVEDINPILMSRLKEFQNNGGTLAIIPNLNTTSGTFRELLNSNIYQDPIQLKRTVTTINFDHPLFEDVFSEKIKNFDYPSTSSFLKINNAFTPILKFSNGQSFLAEKNKVYSFASPLNSESSNFTNSPLVVPVFYNLALQSSSKPQLYSTVGEKSLIDVKANLRNDEVLKLVGNEQQVIPQQTKLGKTTQINTQHQPETSGYYQLKHRDSTLFNLSFNYNRLESEFKPLNLNTLEAKSFSSVPEAFNSLTEDRKILELWVWMLIFAIGFFLLELLILRFLN